jgi:uncharacterized protein (UPF0332 family)
VDPVGFLEVAEKLHNSTAEAERRTSIGRSYYALYNQIVAGLGSAGVHFEKDDAHGRLVYYLSRCSPKQAPTLGEDLKTLRNYRNDADYDMKKQITAPQSEFAYKKARLAVQKFAGLNQSEINAIAQCIGYLPPYKSPGRAI